MKNITITIRSKTIRMSTENKLVLSQIIANNMFAVITGEKDGRKYRYQLLSNGARWVEVK